MPKWMPPSSFALALAGGLFLRFGVAEAQGLGLSLLMLVAALVLLVLGADFMVHGAVRLARMLGVSPFFIGVTVVAFGTSAPELAASVGASLKGAGDLAIGNVLGSNIANICLILGITAVIRPIPVERSIWRVDAPIMLAITLASAFVMLDRLIDPAATIGRIDGLVLVLGLIAYIAYNAKAGKIDPDEIEHGVDIELNESRRLNGNAGPARAAAPVLLILVGLAGLVLGAELLVDAASSIAASVGVSASIIGLTVVAFGTSVPELVFSARAAMKDHPEIAIGNIIGSNVFNLLGVLGVAALAHPIPVPLDAVHRDIWFLWVVTVACCVMMKTQKRVNRREGTALLLGYAAYTAYLYLA
jgi:cation:H+ antiporter